MCVCVCEYVCVCTWVLVNVGSWRQLQVLRACLFVLQVISLVPQRRSQQKSISCAADSCMVSIAPVPVCLCVCVSVNMSLCVSVSTWNCLTKASPVSLWEMRCGHHGYQQACFSCLHSVEREFPMWVNVAIFDRLTCNKYNCAVLRFCLFHCLGLLPSWSPILFQPSIDFVTAVSCSVEEKSQINSKT